MAFLKILVPVTGTASSRDKCALDTAFAVARPFNAHIVALFVHADPHEALPFGELPLSPDFVQELIDVTTDVEKAASDAARTSLAEATAEAGVRLVSTPQASQDLSASYEEMTGNLPLIIGRVARLYDLVVFPPVHRHEAHDMPGGFDRVLLKTACPVLLSAHEVPPALGRRIAIGWDDGIACARALVTALPHLRAAETVELLTVSDKTGSPAGIDEAAAYLALHGVIATIRTIAPGGRKIAQALQDDARAGGADMLVIGGYSRGRMTEAVFGGVTEYIVSRTALPTYMVH